MGQSLCVGECLSGRTQVGVRKKGNEREKERERERQRKRESGRMNRQNKEAGALYESNYYSGQAFKANQPTFSTDSSKRGTRTNASPTKHYKTFFNLIFCFIED